MIVSQQAAGSGPPVATLATSLHQYFGGNSPAPVDFKLAQISKLKSIIKAREFLLKEEIYADYRSQDFNTFRTQFYRAYDEIAKSITGEPE